MSANFRKSMTAWACELGFEDIIILWYYLNHFLCISILVNRNLNELNKVAIFIIIIIIIIIIVDHAMICQRRGLVIQRHNEIRDLQVELLDMVCYDVQVEPALQPITGEELARGTNQAPDARLDWL